MTELVTPGERLGLAVRPRCLRRPGAVEDSRCTRSRPAMRAFECRRSCAACHRLPPPLPAHRPCRPPSRLWSLQSEYDAGTGTCVRDTFVCATLVGEKRVLPAAEGESEQVRGRCEGGAAWACWFSLDCSKWQLCCRRYKVDDGCCMCCCRPVSCCISASKFAPGRCACMSACQPHVHHNLPLGPCYAAPPPGGCAQRRRARGA